jgi:ankyrin repeat protein
VLHAATRYGRMDLVEILLDAGCDVNVLDNVSYDLAPADSNLWPDQLR